MILFILCSIGAVVAFLIAWDSLLEIATTKAGLWEKPTYVCERVLIKKHIKWFLPCYVIQASCIIYVIHKSFEEVDIPTAIVGTIVTTSIVFAAIYCRKRPNRPIKQDHHN